MRSKSFIVYPKTQIPVSDSSIQVIDAPIKIKLKAFITGYLEDHGELPSVPYVQSLFRISEQDAHMALTLFGK